MCLPVDMRETDGWIEGPALEMVKVLNAVAPGDEIILTNGEEVSMEKYDGWRLRVDGVKVYGPTSYSGTLLGGEELDPVLRHGWYFTNNQIAAWRRPIVLPSTKESYT